MPSSQGGNCDRWCRSAVMALVAAGAGWAQWVGMKGAVAPPGSSQTGRGTIVAGVRGRPASPVVAAQYLSRLPDVEPDESVIPLLVRLPAVGAVGAPVRLPDVSEESWPPVGGQDELGPAEVRRLPAVPPEEAAMTDLAGTVPDAAPAPVAGSEASSEPSPGEPVTWPDPAACGPLVGSGFPAGQPRYDWEDRRSVLFAARQQAEQQLVRARGLAGRGATYSARAELESALVILASSLDEQDGTDAHSRALRAAFLALDEAGDFVRHHPRGQLNLDVGLIVARHRSGAVSNEQAAGCSPADAADRYAAFARQQFSTALENSRLAAHVLYGLGTLHAHFSETDSTAERLHVRRAIVLHESALAIDHSQTPAAQQLALLLARSGRLPEARDVLRNTGLQHATPQTWQLLAELHERLGEPDLAALARAEELKAQQLAGSPANGGMAAPHGVQIRWVDKATFERAGADQPTVSGANAPGPAPWTAQQRTPAGRNWR